MAYRVFLSYSTRDLPLVRQVKIQLEKTGTKVFLAEYTVQPGSDLGPSIIKAIKECDLFILFWSEYAKTSEWVPQEIGVAKASEKPVIPVLLYGNIDLPGFLKGLKYLPLYEDPIMAITWLKRNVFARALKKQQNEGLTWLGIGAVVLWLINESEKEESKK